jgi:hypothetical protein
MVRAENTIENEKAKVGRNRYFFSHLKISSTVAFDHESSIFFVTPDFHHAFMRLFSAKGETRLYLYGETGQVFIHASGTREKMKTT